MVAYTDKIKAGAVKAQYFAAYKPCNTIQGKLYAFNEIWNCYNFNEAYSSFLNQLDSVERYAIAECSFMSVNPFTATF